MFRFTLRELVLLTAVVGLAVGWWVDHRLTASMRVGPPRWHGVLRAIVLSLQQQELEIEKDQVLCVGVLSESGTFHWSTINWKPPSD
jgi:hypothetical protein